jgi:hypothetical protein
MSSSAHNHPGYQSQTAHTHCKGALPSRLPINVIIITPPQASDSDFTEKQPSRKTSRQRPHKARIGLWQTDYSSHRRLAAPILAMSFKEEICKTRAEEEI